VRWGWYR